MCVLRVPAGRFGDEGVFLCLSVCAPKQELTVYLWCVWICIYGLTLGKGCVSMCVNWVGVYGKEIGTEEGGCVRAEWGIPG